MKILSTGHLFIQLLALVTLLNVAKAQDLEQPDLEQITRVKRYHYSYKDREHSMAEHLTHLGIIYGISWGTYYLTQPTTFKEKGSFKVYRENLGKIVLDKDTPLWNWVVHPYSGSQLYLYFRANGYTQIDSIKMAFISSSLFEFLVEVYTEPASFQDLYQTPVFGSILGLSFEKLSLYLLNTGNPVAKWVAHIINPFTLFPFYEGKIQIVPAYEPLQRQARLDFRMSF